MKRTIVLLLIAYSVTSCHDYSHHYVPKELIPDLKNNEIVCFRDSGKPDIDTFRIKAIETWWPTQEGTSFQIMEYKYTKFTNNSKFLNFSITTAFGGGINYSIIYENTHLNYGIVNKNLNLSDLIINIKNTYISYDYSTIITDTIPNKVSFNFQKGIIRYEYKDGRVYNLLSK